MTFEKHNLTVTIKGTLPRVPFLAMKEKILGKNYDLSVAFVGPAEARELNIAHRNKDYVPNTLAFPLTKTSGEIVMCRSAIRAQYKKFDMPLEKYLIFLFIHSCLHLKGYSHGSTMERKEKQLLKLFAK